MVPRFDQNGPEGAGEGGGPAGLIVLLPERPRDDWHWWRAEAGEIVSAAQTYRPGDEVPWGAGLAVVALAPAALAPVRFVPCGDMPLAQVLRAAQLDPPGLRAPVSDTHVVAVPGPGGDTVACAAVARADMDTWLAELAAAGLDPQALVPAALLLPAPGEGAVSTARIGEQALARTATAAFAGEADLLPALAPGAENREVGEEILRGRLAETCAAPEIDLRQGAYALPRTSWFHLPDWRELARMAAVLAMLVFLIFAVETVRLNLDAGAREDAALQAAQARLPGVADLASADLQIRAELMRRGAGGVGFADSAAAVFAAMQPLPSVRLRNLNWRSDGTLAIRAAAPDSDALNQMLLALQRDGWQVTVPPEVAPDASGATVADITVRAP